jgi:hypothetical protein
MIFLLICAGGVYFLLGEPKDAIALAISVLFLVVITFFQEKKTERTLQALRNLASPRALVIRDGVHMRISGREVVPGDCIFAGSDRVPADSYDVEDEHWLLMNHCYHVNPSRYEIRVGSGGKGIHAGRTRHSLRFSNAHQHVHGVAMDAKNRVRTEWEKRKDVGRIRQEDTLFARNR